MKATTKYVAYYRVSTARQGASGLGLEAQRESVARFLGDTVSKLVAEFTEVETGKGKDALDKRPQLREAIALAKRHKATILIAKLDRLARNVHFISGLQEAKVPFTAVDMPEASELVIHLMAAMAQHEARMISTRTKAALAMTHKPWPLGGAFLDNGFCISRTPMQLHSPLHRPPVNIRREVAAFRPSFRL